MKILLADQTRVVQAVWNKAMAKAGHASIIAKNAKEALRIASRESLDLICLSLTLPDEDGIELTRKIRRTHTNASTPVVLLTSTVDQGIKEKAYRYGVTDIRSKTDIEALVSRLRTYLKTRVVKRGGRVLYIEDSKVVSHMMMSLLRHMALEVQHFTDADSAYRTFCRGDYDLIISDILVEGQMTGIGLVEAVRQLEGDKGQIPIIAMSGMDDPEQRTILFRLGINDFLSKTASKEEVIARVSNLINTKSLLDKVRAQQEYLRRLAMVDKLTGLYNRNWLGEFVPNFISDANRHDLPLSLLLVDLDHFKRINDERGHLAGDAVLAAVGDLLKGQCRVEDLAVRFGGEEFLILMRHGDSEGARKRAEQIKDLVEYARPEGYTVTVSIGVASRPLGSVVNFDDLFRAADAALYRAKEAGRNRVDSLEIEGLR